MHAVVDGDADRIRIHMSAKTIIGCNIRPRKVGDVGRVSPRRRISNADVRRAAEAALDRRGVRNDPSNWRDRHFGGRNA